MAKKQPPQKKQTQNHILLGLLLILGALLSFGGMVGKAGVGGSMFSEFATWLLGAGALLIPISFLIAGIFILRKKPLPATTREWLSGSIGILSLLGLVSVTTNPYGGIIGRAVRFPFVTLFDTVFGGLILAFVTAGAFTVFFDRTPNLFPIFSNVWERVKSLFIWKKKEEVLEDDFSTAQEIPAQTSFDVAPKVQAKKEMTVTDGSANTAEEFTIPQPKRKSNGMYTPPPLSL